MGALTASMDYASSDDYEDYSSDDDYYSSDEENDAKNYERHDINNEPMNICNNGVAASTSDVSQLLNYLRSNRKVSNASSSELLQKIQFVAGTSNNQPLHGSASLPLMSNITAPLNRSQLHSSVSTPQMPMLKIPAMETINSTKSKERHTAQSPESLFFSILKDAGYQPEPLPLKSTSLSENFFFRPTEYHFKAYNKEVITAVQSQNMQEMRNMLQQTTNKDIYSQSMEINRVFDCCNRFGEGILHMACRKGLKNSVEFLLHEAEVTLRRRDDFGRTPMHDAFWSSQPLLDIVQLLVKHDPDLLLISDTRGSSPLAYAPKDQWPIWCDFLQNNKDLILPRELISSSK